MSHKQIKRSFFPHLDRDFDPERKDRIDKGQTVFNSRNKQNHVFSGLNVQKKEKHRAWRENPKRVDEKELFIEYDALSVEKKLPYRHVSQRLMPQAPFIHQDIYSLILITKRKFPHKIMSAHLGDVFSTSTIRNQIQ